MICSFYCVRSCITIRSLIFPYAVSKVGGGPRPQNGRNLPGVETGAIKTERQSERVSRDLAVRHMVLPGWWLWWYQLNAAARQKIKNFFHIFSSFFRPGVYPTTVHRKKTCILYIELVQYNLFSDTQINDHFSSTKQWISNIWIFIYAEWSSVHHLMAKDKRNFELFTEESVILCDFPLRTWSDGRRHLGLQTNSRQTVHRGTTIEISRQLI
jgi:hypothetical protein